MKDHDNPFGFKWISGSWIKDFCEIFQQNKRIYFFSFYKLTERKLLQKNSEVMLSNSL